LSYKRLRRDARNQAFVEKDVAVGLAGDCSKRVGKWLSRQVKLGRNLSVRDYGDAQKGRCQNCPCENAPDAAVHFFDSPLCTEYDVAAS
jgi:hypothetical protein